MRGNVRRTCRDCGRPISTSEALTYRLGSDCIRDKPPEELERARELTLREADPFYVPADKAPTLEALVNSRNARAAAEGGKRLCAAHASPAGKCALCRRDNDSKRATERIIGEIRRQTRAERRVERLAALEGRFERWALARRAAPRPASRPKPKKTPRPSAPPESAPPGQMTFC